MRPIGGRAALLRAGVAVVLLGSLVALLGCGGSSDEGAGSSGVSLDAPQVKLGGYSFGTSSNVLTHPYLKVSATAPRWSLQGFGPFAGQQMTATFADGGLVAGVKTVRVFITSPGDTSRHKEYNWFAQDAQGNVHMLRYREVDDGHGNSYPAKNVGVAASKPARIWLPKSSALAVGYTWYWYDESGQVRDRRYKILKMSVKFRGQGGLMQIQDVSDENGDGVFSTAWTGPDRRQDFYWNPKDSRLFGLAMTQNPLGGFARQ